MRQVKLSIILLGLLGMNIGFADGTKLGIGVGYGQKPYKGDDSEWVPIPHIEHQSGMLFIKGLKAGINVIDNGETNLNFNIGYQPLKFKPSDSEGALKLLDKRKSTVTAGVGITQNFEAFFVKAALDMDILGRSDGVEIDLSAGKVLLMSNNLTLVPTAGIQWSSKKHNDYYYGVSGGESARSGVRPYQAGSSFTPYVGVGANYRLTDSLNLYGAAKLEILSGEIKDSPMVDRSVISNIAVGIHYAF